MPYNSGFTALTPIANADGSALAPGSAFSSEISLGWYRSAASTVALSYGTLSLPSICMVPVTGLYKIGNGAGNGAGAFRIGGSPQAVEVVLADVSNYTWLRSGAYYVGIAGSATAPEFSSSEKSLGWYASGSSTMKLSYGTLDLTGSGAVTSIASLTIKSGSNNACGTAILGSNGSVNVANTYVKTGDLIFLTDQTPGGTLGDLEILGIRNSSGFTIGSTSITDTSTVAWLIVRPG